MKPVFANLLLILLSILLLNGCGGGGSSSSPGEVAPDQSTASNTSASPSPTAPAPAPTTSTSSDNRVSYRVTFSTIWTEETFPTQYPDGRHFSPLVGMTHNEQAALWIDAGLASGGMELMAETGARTLLNNEINEHINLGYAEFLLNGNGISVSVTETQMEFEVSEDFPLVTLVSMIAPSPDWFVGVNSLDLRDDNGQWRNQVNIGLVVIDAGTDSGETYTAENLDTRPRDAIQLLTTDASDTDFQAGIHRDTTKNIATFRFELL